MGKLSLLLLSGAAMLGGMAAPAAAADYDAPIFIEDAPEYVPVEVGTGWYLRGDIGYSISTSANDDFTYRTFDPVSATYGSSVFDTARISDDFSYGIGVGYQFTEWLRADATLDYFRADFDGTTASAGACVDPLVDPAYAGTSCRSEDDARASVLSVMANGYVDLGTYAGFTPYVGAGAGFSYVRWSDLDSGIYCVDGAGACPTGLVDTVSHGGLDSWRFTYAAMAGVAFDVTPNLKIDLGYKYRRIADGEMFGWDAASAGAGASGTQGRDGGFSSHEVRVGLRYELW